MMRLRSLRLMAAVLAAVGLFARPARAVVICPMDAPAVAVADAVDEHAGHAEHHAPSELESKGQAPEHELCPDLAHCAVAAPSTSSAVTSAGLVVRAVRVVEAQDRPSSAIASLEPPPPKRS